MVDLGSLWRRVLMSRLIRPGRPVGGNKPYPGPIVYVKIGEYVFLSVSWFELALLDSHLPRPVAGSIGFFLGGLISYWLPPMKINPPFKLWFLISLGGGLATFGAITLIHALGLHYTNL